MSGQQEIKPENPFLPVSILNDLEKWNLSTLKLRRMGKINNF